MTLLQNSRLKTQEIAFPGSTFQKFSGGEGMPGIGMSHGQGMRLDPRLSNRLTHFKTRAAKGLARVKTFKINKKNTPN